MNDSNEGGQAFPCLDYEYEDGKRVYFGAGGMTLRDFMAAKAMHGFITNHDTRRHDLIDVPGLAKSAYDMADAMLAARSA